MRESDTTRITHAADAILEACYESAELPDAPFPPELLGTPQCPDCLRSYSAGDLEEATVFLYRLGMLKLI